MCATSPPVTPLSCASCSWRCRSRGLPTRRATANRLGALSGKSSERFNSAASGSRRRPARSSARMVTSITRLTAAKESTAPPKPVGRGKTRLSTVPAAIPATAGTTTTEARTSRLSSGRRCHWWPAGTASRVGVALTAAMCASPAEPRPAMPSGYGLGQNLGIGSRVTARRSSVFGALWLPGHSIVAVMGIVSSLPFSSLSEACRPRARV